MLGVPLFAGLTLGVANVVAEAGNQPHDGMLAVAEVIRNRMERRYQSDGTVAGTIFRPFQFSWANTDNPWRSRIFNLQWDNPQVSRAKTAWEIVHSGLGERSDVAKGAVLYHTIKAPESAKRWPPSWASAPGVVEVARIGDHIFYDDRGRNTP